MGLLAESVASAISAIEAGALSISGVKTFITSPVVPDATTSAQAASYKNITDILNTSTGHDHDGSDSKKVDFSNLTGTLVTKWVKFAGADGAIQASSGVTSVVRNSAGVYTITWTVAFSNANYAVQVNGEGNASYPTNIDASIQRGGQAVGTLVVTTYNTTSAGVTDAYDYVHVIAIGT